MAESRSEWKARMGIGTRTDVARLHGGPGTARTTPVVRDDGPGIAGRTTEHWDGRRDAAATGMTVTPTQHGLAVLANERARIKEHS